MKIELLVYVYQSILIKSIMYTNKNIHDKSKICKFIWKKLIENVTIYLL